MAQTSEMTRIRLIALLTDPEGFGIELFDQLGIARLTDGTFAVWYRDSDEHNVEEIRNATAAVDRFLEIRHMRELGFDYDAEAEHPHQVVS